MFAARLRSFLAHGQIQAVCHADAARGSTLRRPRLVRPGLRHFVWLGPDWTDTRSWTRSAAIPEWVHSVSVPLAPGCPSPPSWDAYPRTSAEFHAACEQLSAVVLGGLSRESPPVIRRCAGWSVGPEYFTDQQAGTRRLPESLGGDRRIWLLQRNYYGVDTLLVEPGHLALTDPAGRNRRLERPESWFAGELEGGTRQQPPGLG